ncbi:fibulin-1-like isoform X2 [Planococcus citri]|uniref:fibulin-1-like isoform X2 n=1 Tax=Planococcus citri TaxID=170843 RepID=UPI0031F8223F
MLSNRYFFRAFLLAFCCFFHSNVEGNLDPVFQKCCAIGKNKTTDALKCEAKIRTPIANIDIEHQSTCLSTIDLCCIQSLRDIACAVGRQAAKQNKICNIQPKSDEEINYKHCCEACKLGIISASMAMDCKLRDFHFGYPWDNAYETCCSEFYVLPPAPSSPISDEPNNLCQSYPGELCSQICVPVGGSYKCQCRSGYVLMADGKSCQPEITENRCEKYNICQQNCFDNGETLECSCRDGYELLADNKTCVDINECNLKLDNCSSSGKVCRNTEGSYECIGNSINRPPDGQNPSVTSSTNRLKIVCPNGYRQDPTSNTCVDIDECLELNACNRNSETCQNTPGSYYCIPTALSPRPVQSTPKCGNGLRYDNRSKVCLDIDECTEFNFCENNELCENLIGSFKCECKAGYERDKMTGACIDVNECQLHIDNCAESTRCDNTIGSYQCTRLYGCGTGYTLNLASNICEDEDECVIGKHDCPPDRECKNYPGSYKCEKKICDSSNQNCGKVSPPQRCPKGYELINGNCVDINECKRQKNICSAGETCENTAGGYNCVRTSTCAPGLRHNEQKYCVDVDECAEQPSICDHNCINAWGTFFCTCNPGFRLQYDNRSCIDINECEVYVDRRLCIGYCFNTPGSYKCQCPDGYTLGRSGKICEDIDECARGDVCNQPKDVCINLKGSYRCNTINCPPNYINDPVKKNRCIRTNDFCLINKNCTNWPLAYNYAFFSLTSNFPIPASGRMEFYQMKGPSSPTTSSQFSFDVKNIQSGYGVNKTTSDFFKLIQKSPNEVTVALIQSIEGPQEVELDIKLHYDSGVSVGFWISKIFIYVSQHDF